MPESYQKRQEYHPHESPWTMTVPLFVLAGLALVGGALNLPFTSGLHFLGHWLEPSLFGNEAHVSVSAEGKWLLGVIAVITVAVAITAAFLVYLKGRRAPESIEKPGLGLAMTYDKALADFMGGPGTDGFNLLAWFDRTVIDGAVNALPVGVQAVAGRLRLLQSGYVRSYAVVVVLGTAVLAILLLRSLVL